GPHGAVDEDGGADELGELLAVLAPVRGDPGGRQRGPRGALPLLERRLGGASAQQRALLVIPFAGADPDGDGLERAGQLDEPFGTHPSRTTPGVPGRESRRDGRDRSADERVRPPPEPASRGRERETD